MDCSLPPSHRCCLSPPPVTPSFLPTHMYTRSHTCVPEPCRIRQQFCVCVTQPPHTPTHPSLHAPPHTRKRALTAKKQAEPFFSFGLSLSVCVCASVKRKSERVAACCAPRPLRRAAPFGSLLALSTSAPLTVPCPPLFLPFLFLSCFTSCCTFSGTALLSSPFCHTLHTVPSPSRSPHIRRTPARAARVRASAASEKRIRKREGNRRVGARRGSSSEGERYRCSQRSTQDKCTSATYAWVCSLACFVLAPLFLSVCVVRWPPVCSSGSLVSEAALLFSVRLYLAVSTACGGASGLCCSPPSDFSVFSLNKVTLPPHCVCLCVRVHLRLALLTLVAAPVTGVSRLACSLSLLLPCDHPVVSPSEHRRCCCCVTCAPCVCSWLSLSLLYSGCSRRRRE